RQLRGDVDAIVLKAVEADPARRYASAAAFADDVERLLDGRPVRARAPTRWYRARKFVLRHKGGVATTVALVLAVLASLGLALWQARIAHTHAAIAQAHANRADAVRQFMVGVFENASPDVRGGQPITAQELLAKGEKQVDSGLRDEPALEADVLTLLGQLDIEIGEFDEARRLLGRALEASAGRGVPTEVRVRALTGMALIEVETNAYDAALGHARQALSLLGQAALPDAADVANAHQMIAQALIGKGDRKGVEAMLRANLAGDEAALGRASEYVADQWLQLGDELGEQGRYDEAERAFRNAIEGYRLGFGESSNRVAHALNEYSNMLEDKGDLAGAEAALRRALAIREATVGANNHDTMTVEANLLYVIEAAGRYAEALPQRLALLARGTEAGALHDRDQMVLWNAIARDYQEQGRFDDALRAYAKALDVATRSQGERSSWRAGALSRMSVPYRLTDRLGDAEAALRESLSIFADSEPAGSPNSALAHAELGWVLLREHRVAEALAESERAVAAFGPDIGAGHPYRPMALAAFSDAQRANGALAEALATATSAVDYARRAFPRAHPALGAPLFALAEAQLALAAAKAAERTLREALAVRSPPYPADDPRVLEVEAALAAALRGQGRHGEAAALAAEVRPLLRASASPYARALEARLQ
ncbi:MAG TPA: tetratricopeptide repeat protein, partial [Dokdonella sp.]